MADGRWKMADETTEKTGETGKRGSCLFWWVGELELPWRERESALDHWMGGGGGKERWRWDRRQTRQLMPDDCDFSRWLILFYYVVRVMVCVVSFRPAAGGGG